MGGTHLKLLVLGLLSFYFLNKAECLESESIQGGRITQHVYFGYFLALRAGNGGVCGAALISKRHALTAAHCLLTGSTITLGPTIVTAVVFDIRDNIIKYLRMNVIRSYMLDRYRYENGLRYAYGDIAVLKLESKVSFARYPNLKFLQLPKPYRSFANQITTFTGYGASKKSVIENNPNASLFFDNKLRYAFARVYSPKECRAAGWEYDSFLCAQLRFDQPGQKDGLCDGDSGGPLVYKSKIIVAVASHGLNGCDEAYEPSKYTRVSSFLDFITSAMDDKDYRDMIHQDYPTVVL